MENNLYVSPSPHIHGGDSISKNMYGVLIALVPAFLVSLYFFGLGALIVTVASVFFCVLFEYLIQKFLMKFTIYKDWEKAEGGYIQDCIECGSCSYTCPAHRPLLDQIRLGKGKVMGIIRARKS